MAVGVDDVAVEQKVDKEEKRELKELKEAAGLVLGVNNASLKYYRQYGGLAVVPTDVHNWKVDLEKAARLIADSKMHNERVRKLAKRLYNDIKDIRGARKKVTISFLTKVEADCLVRCNNIRFVLDEAFAKTQQAKGVLDTQGYFAPVISETYNSYQAIMRAFNLIFELFRLEAQVEEATKKYVEA